MLVAATSSALVVAFVVPLCALLVTVAEDRASARARDQAQSVAALLGTVEDPAALGRAIETLAAAGPPTLRKEGDFDLVSLPTRLRAYRLPPTLDEPDFRDFRPFTGDSKSN